MSKLSNMMYLVDLLNTGNVYSIKELAEKLDVTERMIRYYKEELLKNGIIIESFKGPNGGYFIIDKVKNYISINKYDLQLLDNVFKFLNHNNFEYSEKFGFLLEKCKKMYSISEEKSKFISNINVNQDSNIENIILDSIHKNDKLDIIYDDIDGGKSKRTIHPLYLFEFKDIKYVTAYCELRNDIRHFEINRISL